MRTLLVVLVLALLAIEARAEPCKTQGHADAKELVLDWNQKELRAGLFASVKLGLSPPSFPIKEIETAKAPCSRGMVVVGADQFELFGENEPDDGSPRWAKSPTKKDVLVFLALMPLPEAALSWETGQRRPEADGSIRFAKNEWMWALVAMHGLRGERRDYVVDRSIITLFDKIPDDGRLKAEIKAVVEGKRTAFATFNEGKWPIKFELKAR